MLVLSIYQFILTDDCTTNIAKQIWDANTAKYKEKSFVIRFILFIHLVNTKAGEFKFISEYNADFLIKINKLLS